jgi:propionyl-CoA carboxylase alpha chain
VSLEEDAITVDGAGVAIALEYTPGDRLVEVELYGDDAEDDDAEPVATYGIQLDVTRGGYRMTTRGAKHDVRVLPAHIAGLAAHMIEKVPPDLSKFLICPMPGLLVKLHVGEGDAVQPGQPLATVEAMKMENILRAEKAGTVAKVNAQQGASLAVDEVILELA